MSSSCLRECVEDEEEEEEFTPLHKARLHEPTAVRGVGVADDIGGRPDMEDSFVFVDGFGGKRSSAFMAIYDGHGGRRCVDFVCKRLHQKLLENLTLEPPPEQEEVEKGSTLGASIPVRRRYMYATEALVNAYTQTDEAFRNELQSLEGGCTAVTCLLQYEFGGDRTIYCAHVGDSRAVLCRGRKALRLTSASDHKATDPVEVARITQKGGIVVNDRVNGMLAIARALGDFRLKRTISAQMVARAAEAREKGEELPPILGNVTDIVSNIPDVSSIVLKETLDHFLILACDGVWDVVSDQEAVDLILEVLSKLTQAQLSMAKNEQKKCPLRCGNVAQIAATALVEEALSRGSMDNVTVMIVLL
ncbi:serine-threonine phosophatase 2C, putative [Perkinsus marinus ATCC 50983]|uniref:Serine-threonine phosophatase 2C, putative n=1 Tax=Perkinsus marinus (strain ATCC 50983 / TXsc) TaxID=423536 RepID=C5LZZ1_PERM5|nr:serine-threonine phosophatase 2C, putative [Perkinsus marinus ATCC 50983]EEQ97809.1 serine-threonine phosophatase 2C, putative [Perkinsus marinus ATCC 50983]|eukprot:XP_002765092.1 serine-threonine phosophatase 2C, putative [Perkinsus marinus ATCC 50983]